MDSVRVKTPKKKFFENGTDLIKKIILIRFKAMPELRKMKIFITLPRRKNTKIFFEKQKFYFLISKNKKLHYNL